MREQRESLLNDENVSNEKGDKIAEDDAEKNREQESEFKEQGIEDSNVVGEKKEIKDEKEDQEVKKEKDDKETYEKQEHQEIKEKEEQLEI